MEGTVHVSANLFEKNGENTIRLESAPNFREVELIGKNPQTLSGRWALFRSGHLANLSQPDQAWIENLGFSLICDLRLRNEREAHPSRINPLSVREWANFEIMPDSAENFRTQIARGSLTAENAREAMIAIYREFVTQHSEDYSNILWHILTSQSGPVLIHCAAGKDRTGWAIALLLLALGASSEIVMKDYLSSQLLFPTEDEIITSQKEWREKGAPLVTAEALRPLYQVHEEYLLTALRAAEELNGSLGTYMEKTLGLGSRERARLHKRFFGEG